jgi:hypothetical protein
VSPPKKKVKKKWIIEYRWWYGGSIFSFIYGKQSKNIWNDWRVNSRYNTKKSRDMALKILIKKQKNYKDIFNYEYRIPLNEV